MEWNPFKRITDRNRIADLLFAAYLGASSLRVKISGHDCLRCLTGSVRSSTAVPLQIGPNPRKNRWEEAVSSADPYLLVKRQWKGTRTDTAAPFISHSL